MLIADYTNYKNNSLLEAELRIKRDGRRIKLV